MGRRQDLHKILVDILGSDNVYFQPPESIKMKYPCIVYSRDYQTKFYADNISYLRKKRYQVIVIDRNPDSCIPDKVDELPMTSFERHFASDNLNHDVYIVYF